MKVLFMKWKCHFIKWPSTSCVLKERKKKVSVP